MRLKSLSYFDHPNSPEAWYLDEFTLGQINLIVGKNATGKTRSLNVIGNLANLVSGDDELKFVSANWEVIFENVGMEIKYTLKTEDRKVVQEDYIENGEPLLLRGSDQGKGSITAVEQRKVIPFQTPENELAAVARRDSIQHPFFEKLYLWGKGSRHYYFSTELGKDTVVIYSNQDDSSKKEKTINLKETDKVVGLFIYAEEKYGSEFTERICSEMRMLGYEIDEVGVGANPRIGIQGVGQVGSIYVKEADLKVKTFQDVMSRGMFRALSLIIQINVSQLESTSSLYLIDDIGEGLDFERSTKLINLLIEKAQQSPNVQLVMATNDRFVMNSVPLEYWAVLQRNGNRCSISNYQNSKEIFDDFEFTGLNNFDFFSTEFYRRGLSER
jgi:hypothetical protein